MRERFRATAASDLVPSEDAADQGILLGKSASSVGIDSFAFIARHHFHNREVDKAIA